MNLDKAKKIKLKKGKRNKFYTIVKSNSIEECEIDNLVGSCTLVRNNAEYFLQVFSDGEWIISDKWGYPMENSDNFDKDVILIT